MYASGGGDYAQPKSKITLYISCHGADLPDSPIEIDPSVRILSQAGKFGCLGFFDYLGLDYISMWIKREMVYSKNFNTYSWLEYIKLMFETLSDSKNPINKSILEKEYHDELEKYKKTGKKSIKIRQINHTHKAINKKDNWQIYTPTIEHMYNFADTEQRGQTIYAVDIQNNPTSSKIKLRKNMFEYFSSRQPLTSKEIKQEFHNKSIDEVLKLESLNFGEKYIENTTGILLSLGCDNLTTFIDCLKDRELYNEIMRTLTEENFYNIVNAIRENYSDKIISPGYVFRQSVLVKFLKDEGFDIINIIDMSCRTYNTEIPNEKFSEINAKDDEASRLIDKTLGGKKSTRKKRRNNKRKSKRK